MALYVDIHFAVSIFLMTPCRVQFVSQNQLPDEAKINESKINVRISQHILIRHYNIYP